MPRITMESLMAPGGILDASGRLVQTLYQAPLERRKIEEDLRRTKEAERQQQVGLQAGALQFLITEKEREAQALEEQAAMAASGGIRAVKPYESKFDELEERSLKAADEMEQTVRAFATQPFMTTAGGEADAATMAEARSLGIPGATRDQVIEARRANYFATSGLTREKYDAAQAEKQRILAQDAADRKAYEAQALAQSGAPVITGPAPVAAGATGGVDMSERRLKAEHLRAQIEGHRRELARIVGVSYGAAPQFVSKDPGAAARPALSIGALSAPAVAPTPVAAPVMPPAPTGTQDLSGALADVNAKPKPGSLEDPEAPVARKANGMGMKSLPPDGFNKIVAHAVDAFEPFRTRRTGEDEEKYLKKARTKTEAVAARDAFQSLVAARLMEHGVSPDVADRFTSKIKASDALRLMEQIEQSYTLTSASDVFGDEGSTSAEIYRSMLDQMIGQLNAGPDRVPAARHEPEIFRVGSNPWPEGRRITQTPNGMTVER